MTRKPGRTNPRTYERTRRVHSGSLLTEVFFNVAMNHVLKEMNAGKDGAMVAIADDQVDLSTIKTTHGVTVLGAATACLPYSAHPLGNQ